jgi:hypothetical protein
VYLFCHADVERDIFEKYKPALYEVHVETWPPSYTQHKASSSNPLFTCRGNYGFFLSLSSFLLSDSLLVLTSREGRNIGDTNSGQVLNSTWKHKCTMSLFSSFSALSLLLMHPHAQAIEFSLCQALLHLKKMNNSGWASSIQFLLTTCLPIKMYGTFVTSAKLVIGF